MAATAFGSAIEFLHRLGVFETVLPFLLVFTLVFAFLEKTKIFGTETYLSDYDHKHYTVSRKNLNSMIAFVIAFFVVASTQLVALINEVISKTVLLIILVFAFTLTVGAFHKETKEGFFLNETWTKIFYVVIFLGIALIFLDALNWLTAILNFLSGIWTSEAVAAIIMVIVLIIFLFFITKEPKKKTEEKKE